MEREAKYIVQGLAEVEERLVERFQDVEYEGALHLPAIYYDTFDGRIEGGKAALRVREEKGKLVGCFKATTQQERVFVEEEITLLEDEVGTEWFRRLNHYAEIVEMAGGEEIKPIVSILTERKVYLLRSEGLVVEIALDWVDYLEGMVQEERLEVEMKEGDVERFEAFLHKFEAEMVGLQETHGSKYQKAKEILRGTA